MTEQQDLLTPEQPHEELSTGLKVLSFCIPLAGAIMYFIYKDKEPTKARTACKLALWGFGIGILLNIIATVMRGGSGYN